MESGRTGCPNCCLMNKEKTRWWSLTYFDRKALSLSLQILCPLIQRIFFFGVNRRPPMSGSIAIRWAPTSSVIPDLLKVYGHSISSVEGRDISGTPAYSAPSFWSCQGQAVRREIFSVEHLQRYSSYTVYGSLIYFIKSLMLLSTTYTFSG